MKKETTMRTPARLFWCVLIAAQSAFATIYTVPGTHSTIQAAIAAATAGDTVRVFARTYTGPINVNKSLTLIGSGPDTATIILPPSDFATNSAYNYPLTNFRVERPIVHIGNQPSSISVVFKGFTVDMQRQGPSTGQGVAYSGILAEMCNVTIDSNTVRNILPADSAGSTYNPGIDGKNGRGIDVRGSGSVATIRGNYLEQINRLYILVNAVDSETGPLPEVFPVATVKGNTVVGKGLYNGGQKGIWFNCGAWGVIDSNIVSNLDYTDPVIEPDRASGIVIRFGYLNPARNSRITHNTVTSLTMVNNKGMYIQGIRDTVADNLVDKYRFGIEIHDANATLLARNTVTGGQLGVLINTERLPPPRLDTIVVGGSPANRNVITGQPAATLGGAAVSMTFRDPLGDDFLSPVPVDARYNDFGVYTRAEVAERIWDRADTALTPYRIDTVLAWPFYSPGVRVSLRAFLQGPTNTSGESMDSTLRKSTAFATHFNSVAAPALAVDSISVEIRDGLTTVRSIKPAWLLNNGTLRGFSDTTTAYCQFDNVEVGDYYVVVRHRNHLAIMSALKQTLEYGTSPVIYDFTMAQSQAYGSLPPMVLVGTTRYTMVSGDVNGDSQVNAEDNVLTWNGRNTIGYLPGDVTLDGQVNASDNVVTWNNRNRVSQVP